MSNRAPDPFPMGTPVQDNDFIPAGIPVDDQGNSLIPELAGRAPTHNESVLLSGESVAMASTNVGEIWYQWNGEKGPTLWVRFLDGSLYRYWPVPLSVAVAFIETDSPGRFVWNRLRGVFDYERVHGSTGPRKKPQVVRLINDK